MKVIRILVFILIVVSSSSCYNEKRIKSSIKDVKVQVNDDGKNSESIEFVYENINNAYRLYQELYPEYSFPVLTLVFISEEENIDASYGVLNYNSDLKHIRFNVNKQTAKFIKSMSEKEHIEIVQAMVHKLGYYFFSSVVKIPKRDTLSLEFMAGYFSLIYMYRNYSDWDVNKQWDLSLINFKNIDEFNGLYKDLGLENYDWFRIQLLFLAKKMYAKKGQILIHNYIKTYKNQTNITFVDFLRQQDRNIVENWLTSLITNM